MPSASFTVTVARPLDAVRAYVADLRHAPEWLSFVDEIDLVEGQAGRPGSHFVVRAHGVVDTDMDYRTEAVDAGEVRFAVDHPSLEGTDSYALREVAGGTEVTYTTDVSAKGLHKLATPFTAVALKLAANGASDDFRAAVERT
jgi:uncharacterized membrane protein